MALRAKVINLMRLDQLQNTHQTESIREVSMVKNQARIVVVGILIQVVNTLCVDR